ncbi:hypothetical protein [Polaribacter porphyrae]|uniref:Uncharacterized protein n=1 Tax=Polaribacter porphyrae TaxID=1137780 RepID=A0A2S7WT22_9FLAO|nr:hypothetical protein [Polaribacter porphyrae]PQJ80749.1 hypothetical protein BTO18_16920 [Polaribacter porphyrae]
MKTTKNLLSIIACLFLMNCSTKEENEVIMNSKNENLEEIFEEKKSNANEIIEQDVKLVFENSKNQLRSNIDKKTLEELEEIVEEGTKISGGIIEQKEALIEIKEIVSKKN